jgi:zinc-binding alcohol dehydrogenase family protein
VKINAIAVNPVDYKVRKNRDPQGEAMVLGWDASGVVESVGDQVTLFKPGDEVFYAGDITRPGSYAEYQLVDERIVSHKPGSLSDQEAAALPLTSITAWELLFDRFKMQDKHEEPPVLLVIGASGGVGSILVQLAKQLTDAIVIGTASRPQSQSWVKELGAHHVISHRESLSEQITELGFKGVTHIACLTHVDEHFDEIEKSLLPQGMLGLIDNRPIDAGKLQSKSISIHWEFMFTRPMYQTDDMIEQHKLLTRVAELVDEGKVKTTLGKQMGTINGENLRAAHKILEEHTAVGKMVLAGF